MDTVLRAISAILRLYGLGVLAIIAFTVLMLTANTLYTMLTGRVPR